jgi:predicted dehydrogenase
MPLRVAIVGCGWVGGSQIERGFAHRPDLFAVDAACDADPARLAAFAARHGIARQVASLDAVLAMPDIDVVSICTPPHLHAGQVMAALHANKHVICEKPFVASLALLDQVAAAERSSRRRVMPIFQYRFGDGIAKVRHVIERGLAGRAYMSSIETAWRRGPDYYQVPWRGKLATELGGVLLTQSIHMHDLLMYLIGPAVAVAGFRTTRVNPVEVEDCAVGSLVMADGSLASLTATLGSARQLTRLRFCFEHVTFEKQCEGDAAGRPGDEPWTVIPMNAAVADEISRAMAEVPPAASGFARQFELFAAALASGDPFPVTLADARRSLELITALFEANESGRVVPLPIGPGDPRYEGWTGTAAVAAE